MDTIETIGQKIKELRKKYNLTQVELSERAGVGIRFLRELENGKPTVRMDKVNQVINFLGYHIEIVKDDRQL